MKAKVVDGWPRENAIRIILSDTDSAQVNAIRRALISDVPKLAITRVNITQGVVENDGQILESVNVLPDEVLAHRLAMIPIPTFIDDNIYFTESCEECMYKADTEKGCQQCQIIYSLNAFNIRFISAPSHNIGISTDQRLHNLPPFILY